jgi:hypothetical protein
MEHIRANTTQRRGSITTIYTAPRPEIQLPIQLGWREGLICLFTLKATRLSSLIRGKWRLQMILLLRVAIVLCMGSLRKFSQRSRARRIYTGGHSRLGMPVTIRKGRGVGRKVGAIHLGLLRDIGRIENDQQIFR